MLTALSGFPQFRSADSSLHGHGLKASEQGVWGQPAEGLATTAVRLVADSSEDVGGVDAKVGPFWEVVAEPPGSAGDARPGLEPSLLRVARVDASVDGGSWAGESSGCRWYSSSPVAPLVFGVVIVPGCG